MQWVRFADRMPGSDVPSELLCAHAGRGAFVYHWRIDHDGHRLHVAGRIPHPTGANGNGLLLPTETSSMTDDNARQMVDAIKQAAAIPQRLLTSGPSKPAELNSKQAAAELKAPIRIRDIVGTSSDGRGNSG